MGRLPPITGNNDLNDVGSWMCTLKDSLPNFGRFLAFFTAGMKSHAGSKRARYGIGVGFAR